MRNDNNFYPYWIKITSSRCFSTFLYFNLFIYNASKNTVVSCKEKEDNSVPSCSTEEVTLICYSQLNRNYTPMAGLHWPCGRNHYDDGNNELAA